MVSQSLSFEIKKKEEKVGRWSLFLGWLADGTGPSHPLEPSASSGQNRVKKANIWRIFFFFVLILKRFPIATKDFFLLGALKARQQGFNNILGCDIWTVSGFVTRDDDWPAEVDTCSLKRRRRWGFEKITHFVLLVAGCRRDVRLINWPAKAVERARRPEIMAVSHRLVLLARSRKTVICGRYRTNVTVNPLANNNNHRQIETKGNNKGITHTTILAVDLDQQNCTFH